MRRVIIGVVLLALHLSAGPAAAQSEVSADVGVRAWVSSGYTLWNFRAAGVDPLSELRWRGTDTVITEGHADIVWRTLVVMLTLGGGRPYDGAFLDDDFLVSGHNARFSATRSQVDGSHVFYGKGDVGYRALQWHETMSGTRGYVDVFVGYQYWEEKYEAFGFQGIEVLSFFPSVVVPQSEPNSTKGITHTYTFHSLRIGSRAVVPLGKGFAFHLAGVLFPYTRTELEDIHHLRTDFAQDPSGRSRANGGFGYEVDAALSYNVWKGLSVEAGYRIWHLQSGSGRDTTFFADGRKETNPFDQIIIERTGPYFGLQYRF